MTAFTCSTEDFENIGIILPDSQETQIWDDPNDTLDATVKTIYYKKSGKSRHIVPALLAEYPLKTKNGKASRKAIMVVAVDLQMVTPKKTPKKKLHYDLTEDESLTPRRSPRLMAIKSSSSTYKEEQPTSKCIDVFLFEVSKTNKGEPKLSKTASVLHDISPDVTLVELQGLLRQSKTSGSVIFAPSAGLYWLRRGCKQMVELKTENYFFSCKEEYKDGKDKKLSCIRIACTAIDLNGATTGARSAVDRPAKRSQEYSPNSIEAKEQQLVEAASKVTDTKSSNDIWNDVHCELVRDLEKKGTITRYSVRHLKLWTDLIIKGTSAGVGDEPNWEEFIDLVGVPPKKRRERAGAVESQESSTDDLLKAMMIQNQRTTEVFQTSLLAILANQQVQSPMFTGRISPQLTSTPIFMSSAAKLPSSPTDSSASVKSYLEKKKDVATYTHAEVINFLDANNLGSFVPKFVEAEFDGPLFASLCHPHFGSSILRGMGIGSEDGEAILEAIRREMKQ